ncbi:MAG: S8 family serine peptidase [Bacteroidota bacterium]
MTKNLRIKEATLFAFLLVTTTVFAQTSKQKQEISNTYDLTKLSQLSAGFSDKASIKKNQALRLAEQNGWEEFKLNADGSFDELMAVSEDGQPIYYTIYNEDAARSTRANHLNIGGSLGLSLDGQNMTAHVWDGGATRPTHQEFDGPGGSNRVTINDGVTGLNGNSFHAQHVTGTIVASGVQSAAKGMAPRAKALSHEWTNDLSEATQEAANGMLLSNHSYGFRASLVPDYYFGAYIEESRDWDNLMYNSPFYLMVVAAGNDGNDNSSNAAPLNGNSSYDKLTGHSTSKNNMVVANAQDANVSNDGSLNSVLINSGSSEGPTDDLRIKPDIAGNGTGVYSSYDRSDSDYNSISGTSMASPNVTGTLLLLQQHYNNLNGNFMKAATLKGLALHTADDAGISGPDAVYGWGLLNAKVAAEAISDVSTSSMIDELTLSPGQTYTVTVNSDGVSPLLASISWTDPAGTANLGTNNLTTPVLVNDLDIRLTQGGSTFSPYLLTNVNSNTTGDNFVDPFERVDVSNASGAYTLTVTHKGSLSGGSQDFSLIVTGIVGTPPVCNATTPVSLTPSSVGTTSASLSWASVPGASYELRYRVVGTTSWTVVDAFGTSTTLSGLSGETTYEAQVRSICPDGSTSSFSSSVTFTTGSTNCTGGISSFPYSESFENTLGAWTQDAGDDINWTIQSGGTPSSGTGPSGANDGTYYIYMEVSVDGTGYPNKRAILNSPCFDLGGVTSAVATFDYQMTGGAVGTIDLELSNDNGGTWTSVWSQSGDQGLVWSSTTINLASYVGSTILLRFNGLSGSSWQGDIAIDGFEIISGGGSGGTGCVGTVSLPYTEGFEANAGWTQVSGDDGDWVRDLGGTPSNGTGPSSAIEGSFYMFLEASTNGSTGQIGSNATAILQSGCFDLSSVSSASFSFGYHMFGTSIGSLELEASTDDGSTWAGLWSESGNQGNTWNQATIDLSAYAGGGVQLRFVGTTGTSWSSDIAIDQLSLTGGTSVTSSAYEITSAIESELSTLPLSAEIYPNPVIDNLLNVTASKEGLSYKVVNTLGQVILSGNLKGQSIDVSHVSSGIYMLELSDATESMLLRFIKD